MVTVAAAYGERAASFGGLWPLRATGGHRRADPDPLLLSLYPMVMLLYGSLHSTPPGIAGEFNLHGYVASSRPRTWSCWPTPSASRWSRRSCRWCSPSCSPGSWRATDTPGRGVLEVLITLPFFIPPILNGRPRGPCWGNAQVGTINLAWRWLTGSDGTLVDVYSYGGVVWHMMQYSTPFIFLFVVDAFRAMDPSLEESSRMSGATRRADLLAHHPGADAAGHHQRFHPELHSRHGILRIGGVLRHAGRHRGDHHHDLQLDHPAGAARLPVGHGGWASAPWR